MRLHDDLGGDEAAPSRGSRRSAYRAPTSQQVRFLPRIGDPHMVDPSALGRASRPTGTRGDVAETLRGRIDTATSRRGDASADGEAVRTIHERGAA
jgi:hypothetical protein